MKYFILIFISLITLVIITSCGLIQTSSADKETERIAEEYGGIYVFDKKLRDEIIQREKERREYMDDWFKTHKFFTKDDLIQLDKTHPQTLSNGYKYYLSGPSKQELKENDWSLYYQKVKEYMGEEIFKELKPDIILTSFYRIKEKDKEKHIPITFLVEFTWTITTYGLYGDEGAGFRFTETRKTGMGGDNIFYLENGKFIKSNEKRKDMK